MDKCSKYSYFTNIADKAYSDGILGLREVKFVNSLRCDTSPGR